MTEIENNLYAVKNPKKCDISDYENVMQKLIKQFSKQPGIISIYQAGVISVPGISDLDLVLVYEDSIAGADLISYRMLTNDMDRYILMHSPIAINVFLFENMRNFFIPCKLNLLWGRELNIKQHPARRLFELLIASEYILGLIFHVARIMTTKLIRVRSTICALGTLKYDLDACGIDRETDPEAWQFVDRILSLKKEWFILDSSKRMKRLIDILHECPAILLNTLRLVDYSLIEFGLKDQNGGINSLKFGINNNIRRRTDGCGSIRMARSPVAALLDLLPPGMTVSDALWVITDYNVEIPGRLFSLLSGKVSARFRPYFEYRKTLIDYYTAFSKHSKGYAILLPAVRSEFNIVNLRWLSVMIIKKLLNFR